jgi:hypothetical protein
LVRIISNAALRLSDLPEPNADWGVIIPFAHTIKGYEIHGSVEACAEIANEHRHETLMDLRTCLFLEAGRYRHYGENPDESEMEYNHDHIEKIRAKVIANQRD